MNAQAQPFGNTNYFTNPLERVYPLAALLQGITTNDATGGTLSASQAYTISQNIYNHVLSASNSVTGSFGKNYGSSNVYLSPGAIAEVAGVADGGKESEAILRGISNLICSRGSVFQHLYDRTGC